MFSDLGPIVPADRRIDPIRGRSQVGRAQDGTAVTTRAASPASFLRRCNLLLELSRRFLHLGHQLLTDVIRVDVADIGRRRFHTDLLDSDDLGAIWFQSRETALRFFGFLAPAGRVPCTLNPLVVGSIPARPTNIDAVSEDSAR